jgi:transposase-like protein
MTPGRAGAAREALEPADVPSKCPACNSRDVVTTSKVIDAYSYWRCGACGEVWNVARQREGSRYAYRRPFGR